LSAYFGVPVNREMPGSQVGTILYYGAAGGRAHNVISKFSKDLKAFDITACSVIHSKNPDLEIYLRKQPVWKHGDIFHSDVIKDDEVLVSDVWKNNFGHDEISALISMIADDTIIKFNLAPRIFLSVLETHGFKEMGGTLIDCGRPSSYEFFLTGKQLNPAGNKYKDDVDRIQVFSGFQELKVCFAKFLGHRFNFFNCAASLLSMSIKKEDLEYRYCRRWKLYGSDFGFIWVKAATKSGVNYILEDVVANFVDLTMDLAEEDQDPDDVPEEQGEDSEESDGLGEVELEFDLAPVKSARELVEDKSLRNVGKKKKKDLSDD